MHPRFKISTVVRAKVALLVSSVREGCNGRSKFIFWVMKCRSSGMRVHSISIQNYRETKTTKFPCNQKMLYKLHYYGEKLNVSASSSFLVKKPNANIFRLCAADQFLCLAAQSFHTLPVLGAHNLEVPWVLSLPITAVVLARACVKLFMLRAMEDVSFFVFFLFFTCQMEQICLWMEEHIAETKIDLLSLHWLRDLDQRERGRENSFQSHIDRLWSLRLKQQSVISCRKKEITLSISLYYKSLLITGEC